MSTRAGARLAVGLLERDDELAAIDGVLRSAAEGTGVGLLVRGPAGIGKSALVDEARRRARAADLAVLEARGALFERDYAFGVARQLLVDAAADAGLGSRSFSGSAAAASVLSDGVVSIAPDAAVAATYGLYGALMNLAAKRPLVLCIDDLQWSDEPSIRLLDFALRRIGEVPVAIVAAWRRGEADAPDPRGALSELETIGALEVVEPAPLGEASAVELARRTFRTEVDWEFAAACHTRAAGNPFFLSELLRDLAEDGVEPIAAASNRVGRSAPRGVNRVVLSRLARLGSDAAALARAVAVLGDGARLSDAAELGGLSHQLAATATERLIAADVLRDGDGLSFVHPLMRDAVEADMPEVLVGERHVRAADVLAEHGRDPEAIAAHTLASPPAGNAVAVERLRTAARIAAGRGAPAEAVVLLDRAVAEPPPDHLLGSTLFELGAAEAAARHPGAVQHLDAALDHVSPGSERGRVALVLARLLAFAGRSAGVYETIRLGQDGLDAGDRDLDLALEAAALAAHCLRGGGDGLTPARIARFSKLDGGTPGERAVLAVMAFGLARAAHPVSLTLELAQRAIDHGGCDLRDGSDPFTALMLTLVLNWGGQLKRAGDLVTSIAEQTQEIGSSLLFTEAIAQRAFTRWRAGALDEAEADARQSLETEGMMPGRPSPIAIANLVKTLSDRGAHDEAHELILQYGVPGGHEDQTVNEILLSCLGRVEVAMGRNQDALSRLTRAGEIADASGTTNPAASDWRLLATEALLGLGRGEDAAEMLGPALEAARRSGGPSELGSSLRLAALVQQPVSVELLEQALAILEPSDLELERARALVELGAALRRSGARREAREPLADGMERAHRCGATPLVERARAELLAAGARPRRIERTGVDSLTASERRVAALASDGRSNREIAHELFVSSRTVEAHLRSAYMKLDIASRRDLGPALARTAEVK